MPPRARRRPSLARPATVVAQAFAAWESHHRQREHAEKMDLWFRGRQQEIDDHDESGWPFMPDGKASTREYRDIASRASNNWGEFLVKSLAQTCSLEGVYLPGSSEVLDSYYLWQENRWDGRQNAVYEGAIGHGVSFTSALPAVSRFGGGRTARFNAYSAKRMSAYFNEVEDEYPAWGMVADVQPGQNVGEEGWSVRVLDETAVHFLSVKGSGRSLKDWTYISAEVVHDLGFCPIIQYTPSMDLDGRTVGEIEPFIPLLRRIDQDTFDRLIVQRFGAWVVRYGTGLAKPQTDVDRRAQKILLEVGEMLMSGDPASKFGTLSPTELKGFIEAHDADLRVLSAVSQRPPHHMLGLSSNLGAESLKATEQGLFRRGSIARDSFGESHEMLLRTGAAILGNDEEARAYTMQVRWKDTESNSLAQTADALGKLATQLQIPVEILWERLPNWTDSDTQRALNSQQLNLVGQLLAGLDETDTPAAAEPVVPPVVPVP